MRNKTCKTVYYQWYQFHQQSIICIWNKITKISNFTFFDKKNWNWYEHFTQVIYFDLILFFKRCHTPSQNKKHVLLDTKLFVYKLVTDGFYWDVRSLMISYKQTMKQWWLLDLPCLSIKKEKSMQIYNTFLHCCFRIH